MGIFRKMFHGGSGPENEFHKVKGGPEKMAQNFEKSLTPEEAEEPLVTDDYLEETPAETAKAVEEVREKIEASDDDEKIAA